MQEIESIKNPYVTKRAIARAIEATENVLLAMEGMSNTDTIKEQTEKYQWCCDNLQITLTQLAMLRELIR